MTEVVIPGHVRTPRWRPWDVADPYDLDPYDLDRHGLGDGTPQDDPVPIPTSPSP